MRLQKYIAACGIASRRKSEELIQAGIIKVNDETVTEMGYTVEPEKDIIKLNDKIITPTKTNVYILLNKPIGYITTTSDQFGRKKVTDLVNISTRIFPIGRLDYNTSGLLLLTNDGTLTLKLTHPKYKVKKTYIAKVKGMPTGQKIEQLKNGIQIEDYVTLPAKVAVIEEEKNNSILKITIREGKNRQVRKMCDFIGHPVIDLKRIAVGMISLDNLPVGKWRYLTEEEIKYLKNIGK